MTQSLDHLAGTQREAPRKHWFLAGLAAVSLPFAAALFGLIGTFIGLAGGSVEVGAVARTILQIAVLAVVLGGVRRWADHEGPTWLWLGVGLIGYLANPLSWQGHALAAGGFGLTGVTAWAVDLATWMIATVVVCRVSAEAPERGPAVPGLR
ncbi:MULTISPECIES: hypothetical protein [unclassified Janibacter]|uniref:hypothetical protein n=1 Tax=unclassified Janibacter TaxID=2649294 RepID=UPI003CFF7379